jgi:hypothetical protein
MIATAEQLAVAVGAQRPAMPWALAAVRPRGEGGALGARVDVHALRA